jgi:DNA gyrase subunit A
MSISALRIIGRTAQGVKLINLKDGDKIASITIVPAAEDEIAEIQDEIIDLSEDNDNI